MTEKRARIRSGAAGLVATVGLFLTTLSSCTTEDQPQAEPAERGESVSRSPGSKPRHVVEMDGDRLRTFESPTLIQFAQQPGVVNVVRGTVTKLHPVVSQPGNVVETILTVDVTEQRDDTRPTLVEIREQGGLVRVAQVRSDFDGKLGRELGPGELDEWVDFRFDGSENAGVGEQVLIVVGPDPSRGENAYVGLARLKRSSDSSYAWPGRSPNPRWTSSIDSALLLAPN